MEKAQKPLDESISDISIRYWPPSAFLSWIPIACSEGQSGSGKEVSENGKGEMPSPEDGQKAWAEERQGAILQALFAQADQQEVQLVS